MKVSTRKQPLQFINAMIISCLILLYSGTMDGVKVNEIKINTLL